MWHLEARRLPLLLIELILDNATWTCWRGGFTKLSNKLELFTAPDTRSWTFTGLSAELLHLRCDSTCFLEWQPHPKRNQRGRGGIIPTPFLLPCPSSQLLPGRSVISGKPLYTEENIGKGKEYFWPLPRGQSPLMMLGKTSGIIANHSRFKN